MIELPSILRNIERCTKMTDASFSDGDTIHLKSGGPAMTVEFTRDFYGELRVHCVWFVGTKQHRDSFPPTALEKVVAGAPSGPSRSYASFSRD
jgi:uncharacterized protein YodC (DUF2158 family)